MVNPSNNVERKTPDTKEHILYDCIHIMFKNRQNTSCRCTHRGNKPMNKKENDNHGSQDMVTFKVRGIMTREKHT